MNEGMKEGQIEGRKEGRKDRRMQARKEGIRSMKMTLEYKKTTYAFIPTGTSFESTRTSLRM